MPRCFFPRLRSLLQTTVVFSFLLTSGTQNGWADPPEGLIRTFAVEFNVTQPDFFAPDSLGLVVAPKDPYAGSSFLAFADSNSNEFFDSSVWEYRPATHIETGGAEIPGFVTWLVTPDTPEAPPAGSMTFTGPDSPLILHQEVVYIKQCTATTCVPDPDWAGKVRIGTAMDNDGKLLVVTAIFSR